MMSAVENILIKIPGSFWGVLVGSIATLLGVYFTNRASERRLVKQFDHESKQRQIDREMSLKKEVYLAAAEAISVGQKTISKFTELELSNAQVLSEFMSKSPAIPKMHVIASMETIQAISEYMGELDKLFIQLAVKRTDLSSIRTSITINEQQIGRFERSRDALLEQIKQFNIEGRSDQREYQVLQQNFDFEQERIFSTIEKNAELGQQLMQGLSEFSRECVREAWRLGELLTPVLVAVRNELSLPIDSSDYLALYRKQAIEAQQALDSCLEEYGTKGFKERMSAMVENSQPK